MSYLFIVLEKLAKFFKGVLFWRARYIKRKLQPYIVVCFTYEKVAGKCNAMRACVCQRVCELENSKSYAWISRIFSVWTAVYKQGSYVRTAQTDPNRSRDLEYGLNARHYRGMPEITPLEINPRRKPPKL